MRTYALMAASIVSWGFFAWSGFNGIKGLQAQHVPGYPNRGQIEFYVVFPLIMVATALVLPLVLLLDTVVWCRDDDLDGHPDFVDPVWVCFHGGM